MTWFPGWNDIPTVRSIHDFCELWGILLFFIVVVLELGAYAYGHRYDTLVETAQQNQQSKHANQLSALRSQIEEEKRKNAGRHLDQKTRQFLINALAPYAGTKINIFSVVGDNEALSYRNDFVAVFEAAGWDHNGLNGLGQVSYSVPMFGLSFAIVEDEIEVSQEINLPGFQKLKQVLLDLNLVRNPINVLHDTALSTGAAGLVVGSKPE